MVLPLSIFSKGPLPLYVSSVHLLRAYLLSSNSSCDFLYKNRTSFMNLRREVLSFSTTSGYNDSTKRVSPRSIPTRHSKYQLTPIAPMEILDKLKDQILNSKPGTLFEFSPKDLNMSRVEEHKSSLVASDTTRIEVEYILRSYSALIPGSIFDLQYNQKQFCRHKSIRDVLQPHVSYNLEQHKKRLERHKYTQNTQEYIRNMLDLVDRIELEGKLYNELRSKLRYQMKHNNINHTENHPHYETDDSISQRKEMENRHLKKLSQSFGSLPGLSTTMFDYILDAIAVSISLENFDDPKNVLRLSKHMMHRVLKRHSLDLSAEMVKEKTNTNNFNRKGEISYDNIYSCPTHMTFNAVMRAVASVPYDGKDDELRDIAVDTAFSAYDAMYNHSGTGIERNSATYKYMLEIVAKFLPDSPSKGNIAYALFHKATFEDAVLDDGILKALINGFGPNRYNNSKEFNIWMEKKIKSQIQLNINGYGFPLKWGSNKILRRFHKRFSTY